MLRSAYDNTVLSAINVSVEVWERKYFVVVFRNTKEGLAELALGSRRMRSCDIRGLMTFPTKLN